MKIKPEKIDLFDLSDVILERLNTSGNFKLTQYDISLKLSRDINYPSEKFNIYLILFQQEIAVSYFTIIYDSVSKIVDLLFTHLLDDGGFESIEHAILTTKRNHLESLLNKTIEEIKVLLNEKSLCNYTIFVDEQYPNGKVDEKGLPIYELNIYSEKENLELNIELNNQYFGSSEKQKMMNIVTLAIKDL